MEEGPLLRAAHHVFPGIVWYNGCSLILLCLFLRSFLLFFFSFLFLFLILFTHSKPCPGNSEDIAELCRTDSAGPSHQRYIPFLTENLAKGYAGCSLCHCWSPRGRCIKECGNCYPLDVGAVKLNTLNCYIPAGWIRNPCRLPCHICCFFTQRLDDLAVIAFFGERTKLPASA